MGFLEYSKFDKTSRDKAYGLALWKEGPVFTMPADKLWIKQHYNKITCASEARYRSVEETRLWLSADYRHPEADKWLEYLKWMHDSVRDNGPFLDMPVSVFVKGGSPRRLVVSDGDHRTGACVANGDRVPCVITNLGKDEFVNFVDYKTNMPVSVGYDEWRSLDNRYELMSGIDWKGKSVLDIGCGIGSVVKYVKKLGAKSVYGIDSDPACILKATQPGMLFVCHDLARGFAFSGKIDILIMNSIVYWVKSDAFYNSVKRVVDSGAVVLFEAHHEDLSNKLYDRIKQICPIRELIGYTDYKKGSDRKRAVYIMKGRDV